MKLLRCHIENFGKLSNYDYEFQNGLNTIIEENGFGKTTFASFIKAMFYGLETKKNTKVLIDRKRYQPWQGGAFGGSIEFEVKNKTYKVERFFGKKEAEDTFKIYDLSTNLESTDYTENLGEEIFKLNKEAYERSTFLSGQNMETSMNDSINAKLGNILENENDVNSSEQAIKLLEEAIKNYKKTGGRGEINEKIQEKTKLEQKLEQSKIDEKALQERRDKNNKLKQKLKERLEEQENLKKLLTLKIQEETKQAKLENYKILQNNLEESKKALEEMEQFFQAGIPSDSEIETLIEKCLLIEKYKVEIKNYEISCSDRSEIETLKQVFQNQLISEEIINQKFSEYNQMNENDSQLKLMEEKISNGKKEQEELESKEKKQRRICFGLMLFSIFFLILGVITFLIQQIKIGWPSVIVGILCGIVWIIKKGFYHKKSKENSRKKEEWQELEKTWKNLQQEQSYLQKNLQEFIHQYLTEKTEFDMVLQLTEIKTKFIKYKDLSNNINGLFEKQEKIMQKLQELEDSVKAYLLEYFKEVDSSYVTYAQEIKMKKSEFSKQKQDYEAKQKIVEDYKKTNSVQDLEKSENKIDIQNFDKNEIEERIELITKEINGLSDEKNYNKNQMEVLESKLDTVFDMENEWEELTNKIEEMKENCRILEKTKQYLETAKEQFSSHYLNPMKDSFIKNVELLNGNKMDIQFDVNLKVQVNEQGANKEINYFSTGYQDLIYLCMRLSLIDALFEEEKPFILLDDPFVNLDENKIRNATNLLRKLSEKYQLIYFICHNSRGI